MPGRSNFTLHEFLRKLVMQELCHSEQCFQNNLIPDCGKCPDHNTKNVQEIALEFLHTMKY